jgi:hypothetical protein
MEGNDTVTGTRGAGRIKDFLRPSYYRVQAIRKDLAFWARRKVQKARRRGEITSAKATFCILCVKRGSYARLAVRNVNSLHYLDPGYVVNILTDSACEKEVLALRRRFDFPGQVQVKNIFGDESEPWQIQKVRCLKEASRNGWILVDADTIWHGEPDVDPQRVTFLVKAYSFHENEAESMFLRAHGMEKECRWPHYVTGFMSVPPAFYSEELFDLGLEWTRRFFADSNLKRISEELGLNIAIQTLIPPEKITTLKTSDGPNNHYIMESLYYGCINRIEE